MKHMVTSFESYLMKKKQEEEQMAEEYFEFSQLYAK